jgi:hypothetical protein
MGTWTHPALVGSGEPHSAITLWSKRRARRQQDRGPHPQMTGVLAICEPGNPSFSNFPACSWQRLSGEKTKAGNQ